MVNPASLMKMMSAKKKFESNHPKFAAFFTQMIQRGVDEGDIIEITITKADGTPVTANMRVQASDLELINELKNLS